MIPPCSCGHSCDDHDGGYGTCTKCDCRNFEEDRSFMECCRESGDGTTFDGIAPFTTPGDLSTPLQAV